MQPQSGIASLYIGNLASNTTEQDIYNAFSPYAHILSVKLCTNATTGAFLGYAFMNFNSVEEAKDLLDHHNYLTINGKTCRLMWCLSDKSVLEKGIGNLFIGNLPHSLTSKQLNDYFLPFGPIISCKVATDQNDESLGYGFVQYENATDAETAYAHMNNSQIQDQVIHVEHYVPKAPNKETMWTNLYIQNIPITWTDEQLYEMFSKTGVITSAVVRNNNIYTNPNGVSTCIGFVNYETHESAVQAIEMYNEYKVLAGQDQEGQDYYVHLKVCRFLSSKERAEKLEQEKQKELQMKEAHWKGRNLYIKHIAMEVTETELRQLFEPFGEIESFHMPINRDGTKLGIAFVCYKEAKDAVEAMKAMNGLLVHNRPIYVSYWTKKSVNSPSSSSPYYNPSFYPSQVPTLFSGMYPAPRFNNPYNFISYPVPYPPIYYNSTTPSNMYYPPGSNMYFVPGSPILNGLVPLGPEETQPPSEMVMESESTPSSPNKRTRKHRHSNKNASKHDSHSDVIDSLIIPAEIEAMSEEDTKNFFGNQLFLYVQSYYQKNQLDESSITKLMGMLLSGLSKKELVYCTLNIDYLESKVAEAYAIYLQSLSSSQ